MRDKTSVRKHVVKCFALDQCGNDTEISQSFVRKGIINLYLRTVEIVCNGNSYQFRVVNTISYMSNMTM